MEAEEWKSDEGSVIIWSNFFEIKGTRNAEHQVAVMEA